jgi:hypothetical protein
LRTDLPPIELGKKAGDRNRNQFSNQFTLGKIFILALLLRRYTKDHEFLVVILFV